MRTRWLALVVALGLLPAGAGAERGSFEGARAGARTVAEILRDLERGSGVEILWPASIGEHRLAVNVRGLPVEEAVRRILRSLPGVSPDSLAVLYETGNPVPKLIWILDPEGGAPPMPATGVAVADEPEPRYLAPAEPPRYLPVQSNPVYVPEDPAPRDIPIRTEPAYVPPAR